MLSIIFSTFLFTADLVVSAPATGPVTAAVMATHGQITNCWINHQGTAYDITQWAKKHPGGPEVYTPHCGKIGSGATSFDADLNNNHANSKNLDTQNGITKIGPIDPAALATAAASQTTTTTAVANTTSAGAVPAALPDAATDQIRKDAKFKNVPVIGTDATARLDNSWMASCKSGYAFCAWSVPNGANSNDCSTGARIHAHGVVIKGTPGTQEFYNSQLTMNYVQLYDHYQRRNYYKQLPGAKHSCDCGENMPNVRRSDASEMKATPTGRTLTEGGVTFPDPSDPGNFQAAGGNDLATAYKKSNNGQAMTGNLAGKC